MDIKKYSNLFNFNIQNDIMIYTDPTTLEDNSLKLSDIENEEICDLKVSNRLLSVIDDYLLVFVKHNKVKIANKYKIDYIFPVEIHNFNKSEVKINFTNKYIAQIEIDNVLLFEVDDFFAHNSYQKIVVQKLSDNTSINYSNRQRYVKICTIEYNNITIFISYDRFLNEIKLVKLLFDVSYINENIYIELLSPQKLLVKNLQNADSQTINLNNIKLSQTLLKKLRPSDGIRNNHILAVFTLKKKRYFIFNQSNGIHILRSNPKLMSQHRSILKVFATSKSFHIFGLFKHNGYKAKHKFDNLYLQNNKNSIGKFSRPFKNWKLLNQLVYGKVNYQDIKNMNRIHNNLLCGDENMTLHNIKLTPFSKPVKTYKIRRYKDNAMVLRNNLKSNVTLTSIPFSPEYTLSSKFKIFLAKVLSKKKKRKNINLFFEKKSERAEESAIKVFDKAYNMKNTNSEDYFILDKNAPYFNELKEKYGKNLIKKYSLKHFTNIYNSDYFVSSELPNHLINDRLYIDSLRDKIMQTPSVFLQHGIMFAKPVDNPMAYGFHKYYNKYNNIKNVISSDLEAEQFYKMGYDTEELIKTGLATFDNAKLNDDADKIAYMPTYRYWEERLIYSGDITKTSYFQSILKVIKAFEKNNMLERLLIVPHNKFSEFIYDNMPKYKHIIEPNPSTALKLSNIFITDYSSAIYDAIYRGSYPIFYWEEKNYLIENYKAIPPINEMNAPGPVAKDVDTLMNYVQKAIRNNYTLEKEYKIKYSKINEFNDNKNTERIINELKRSNIL